MNSNTQHTPGPWNKDGDNIIRTEAGTCVALPQSGGDGYPILSGDEVQANARLIAAAPDLLAALRGCIHHDDGIKPQFRIPSSLRRQIEAAIAKATEGK